MKAKLFAVRASGVLAIILFGSSFVTAQQTAPGKVQSNLRQSSDGAANDIVLEGTVVSFTASSSVPPLGPHVLVQTSSGNVDVHLGNLALLKQNNISLAAGDAVRIAGSNVPFGDSTIFVARILQKGNQSVTLRNARGIPLAEGRSRAATRAAGAQAPGVVQ